MICSIARAICAGAGMRWWSSSRPLVRALDGLEGVGMLDDTQRRELARLRERPRTRRAPPAAGRPRRSASASRDDRDAPLGSGRAGLAGAGGRDARDGVALPAGVGAGRADR